MKDLFEVEYELQIQRRKSIAIVVGADGKVIVKAPPYVSSNELSQFVQSKQAWIGKQLARFAQRPVRFNPIYRWGEAIYVLGEKQQFHYKSEPDTRILLAGKATDSELQIERKVEQWFKHKALQVFCERHHIWQQRLADWPTSTIKIRRMKSRWGSCRRTGEITLNTHLLKYPVACIDAVLVHELCHLLEFNHSPRFYHLMDQALPEWRQLDDQLNQLSLHY